MCRYINVDLELTSCPLEGIVDELENLKFTFSIFKYFTILFTFQFTRLIDRSTPPKNGIRQYDIRFCFAYYEMLWLLEKKYKIGNSNH